MLNRFKIGTKLTAGFLLVLVLLLAVAGVAYLALDASHQSTQEIRKVEDNLSNILTIRININRAQVQAAKGSLFRDFNFEKARKGIDDEIKTLADSMRDSLSPENQKFLDDLLNEYDNFKTFDGNWYSAERDRLVAQEKLATAGIVVTESLQKCSDSFMEAAEALKEGKENEEKIPARYVRQALEVEHLLTKANDLRRGFYVMMEEPNSEKQSKLGEELLAEAGKLIKEGTDFAKEVVDSGRKSMVETAVHNVEQWKDSVQATMNLLLTQSQSDLASDASAIKMTVFLNSMVDTGKARVATIEKEMNASDTRMTAIMIGTAIFAVVFGMIFSLVLSGNIAGGIRVAASSTKHMAETGDLTLELPPNFLIRKDEVGDLAKSINLVLTAFRNVATMAKELASGDWRNDVKIRGDLDIMNQDISSMLDQVNNTLHEIDESVKQVATGSNEVSSAAQSLSSGAQTAAASLEEITASMSEISSQTKANAESASQARDLAHRASKAATDGQEAMQQMTGAMDRITQNSNQIQQVIKVIDDIAFQTNLLALNAAVEAARAGQHGKGFAVVAEEVRNLAARSAKAAQETSELIAKSGQEILKGGEVASHTAEVLNTIVEQIKQTTDLVAGIAVASNEQALGVNQVTIGLQQIDAVTQQNTASAEESASAANEMSGMATNLQKLVAQFKLR
ncbi:MAG: methyl-accepting chemotaxis protein [Planctomycetaceae bacterium]|nr:methyl-accepting chemotaxis protein [Planctomycetaceae bacterium]